MTNNGGEGDPSVVGLLAVVASKAVGATRFARISLQARCINIARTYMRTFCSLKHVFYPVEKSNCQYDIAYRR